MSLGLSVAMSSRSIQARKRSSLIGPTKSQGAVRRSQRHHRKCQHAFDTIACRNRWGIEGFCAKLKQWQRIAPLDACTRA